MAERLRARTPMLVLILLVFGLGYAVAQNTVVVVPLGEDNQMRAGDCPAASGTSSAGPAVLYNICWYLSDGEETCDKVCSDLGGANLAVLAEDEWDDNCHGPEADDVTTWFFNNGNPAGWTSPAPTTDHHLGFGHGGNVFFGKCSSGIAESGTYPGVTLNGSGRNLACPCFGSAFPE